MAIGFGRRLFSWMVGLRAYLVFLGTLFYMVCFVGNVGAPVKTIDSGRVEPLGRALLIDSFLLALFAVQHSGMARPGFKAWVTRHIPPAHERSTYVLVASCTLLFLFWQWRPIPERVWEVEQPIGHVALTGLFWAGWLLVGLGFFRKGHLARVGLREDNPGNFPPGSWSPCVATWRHAVVRHPVMLGLLLAFWATPGMSYGHVLFALGMTAYMGDVLRLERRDACGFSRN